MDHVVSHQGLLASIENLGCTAQFPPLSPRERSILTLIGYGQSDKEIAKGLGIAPETVKCHIKNIFKKLNVNKRTRAVSVAYLLGMIGSRPTDPIQPAVRRSG